MLSCAPMVGYCLAHLFEEEPARSSCPMKSLGHPGLTLADHAEPVSGFPLTARGNDVAPLDLRFDDTYCWICGAPIVDVHCKIVCKRCGFMRDCSDP